MTTQTINAEETRTVVIEKELPHQPAKVWRALTESSLMAEWLMQNDFQPVVAHNFKLTADWGAVNGTVLEVDPPHKLSYTWAAYGLESVVVWTLTPTAAGTHLHMEQSGFRKDQDQAYKGATYGWQNFLAKLENVVAELD